ncbi:MAG: hypothetical protein R2710_18690 [Acidimicrobiales bacterium]
MNTSIVASGAPADVLTSEVMEATFGAAMEVFDYSGHQVVIDLADTAPIIPLMRDAR